MTSNFIEGGWQDAAEGRRLPILEPATGRKLGEIADSSAKDVDLAVAAAERALAGDWGRKTATERGRILTRMSGLIQSNAERLATAEAQDTGKPDGVARADIAALARYFEFYGGAADKIHGEIVPYESGFHVGVLHEPHGVTGHILPWNYPAQMFGRTLAPALAMGNATVLKPAEDACATALLLADIANEAGFPPGSINIVTGRGEAAGAALAAHQGVNFMSFTGSPEVGQVIQKLCADHYVSCTLELGGKSPQVVFADADFTAAVPTIVRAIIQNSGQTCSAGSRVLVERDAYDRFVEHLVNAFSKITVGPPAENLDCGPLITRKQKIRVQAYIDRAQEAGIPVLARGVLSRSVDPNGFYVTPTLFGPVPRDHPLAREEVFGPVLAVLPFEDEDDAVQIANTTEYGLVAGVWTRDGGRQLRLVKRIRAGQVFVNCYGAGAGIELPFGGSGKSGHGREKGLAALRDFSKTKTMVLNHG